MRLRSGKFMKYNKIADEELVNSACAKPQTIAQCSRVILFAVLYIIHFEVYVC